MECKIHRLPSYNPAIEQVSCIVSNKLLEDREGLLNGNGVCRIKIGLLSDLTKRPRPRMAALSLLADLRHYCRSTLPLLPRIQIIQLYRPPYLINRPNSSSRLQSPHPPPPPPVPSSSSGFLNQSLLAGDTAVVPSASAHRCRGHSATMSLGGKRLHSEQKRRSWRQNPASRRE